MPTTNALIKARKNYPTGTVFKSAVSDKVVTSDGNIMLFEKAIICNKAVIFNQRLNTWAEIIKPLQSDNEIMIEGLIGKSKELFPIGSEVKSALSSKTSIIDGNFKSCNNNTIVCNGIVIYDKVRNLWANLSSNGHINKNNTDMSISGEKFQEALSKYPEGTKIRSVFSNNTTISNGHFTKNGCVIMCNGVTIYDRIRDLWGDVVRDTPTTIEEKIKEAERRYPEGTPIKSVFSKIYVISDGKFESPAPNIVITCRGVAVYDSRNDRWAEVDNDGASADNKLIELAKKKYPIGTVVKSVYSNVEAEIKDHNFLRTSYGLTSGIAAIYDKNKDTWGDIISSPDPLVQGMMYSVAIAKKRYPVNTEIKTVFGDTTVVRLESSEFTFDDYNVYCDDIAIYNSPDGIWGSIIKKGEDKSKRKFSKNVLF